MNMRVTKKYNKMWKNGRLGQKQMEIAEYIKMPEYPLHTDTIPHKRKLEELKRDVVRSLIDATFDEKEVWSKREFITWLNHIETKIRRAKEVCINTL